MVQLPTPIQELTHPLLAEKGIQLFVKRDDLTHPEIMGNKWRKLKYNLIHARKEGFQKIATMGGAFSNHIAATAAAAKEHGFESVGIIRGDELRVNSNPTLAMAHKHGMQLRFMNREAYRMLRDNPNRLIEEFDDHYFLPEGGTNDLAIKGCQEIVGEIELDFDVIVCPIGTGGTFCGLLSSIQPHQKAIGISSLKGAFITDEIEKIIARFNLNAGNFEINTDFHFGGYGKTTSELIDFINWFKEKFNIQLDPIYTGKSFFGVWELIKTDKFVKNLRIVLLHTGGLQGILGFNRKSENIIQ